MKRALFLHDSGGLFWAMLHNSIRYIRYARARREFSFACNLSLNNQLIWSTPKQHVEKEK